jgi:hypothetical protein
MPIKNIVIVAALLLILWVNNSIGESLRLTDWRTYPNNQPALELTLEKESKKMPEHARLVILNSELKSELVYLGAEYKLQSPCHATKLKLNILFEEGRDIVLKVIDTNEMARYFVIKGTGDWREEEVDLLKPGWTENGKKIERDEVEVVAVQFNFNSQKLQNSSDVNLMFSKVVLEK